MHATDPGSQTDDAVAGLSIAKTVAYEKEYFCIIQLSTTPFDDSKRARLATLVPYLLLISDSLCLDKY